MTHQRSKLHIETPIDDLDEIPYDPAKKGPGVLRLVIDLNREETERLKGRHPRGPLIRFIKQAALERADREAEAKRQSDIHAAD